jgi:hypothetical protein
VFRVAEFYNCRRIGGGRVSGSGHGKHYFSEYYRRCGDRSGGAGLGLEKCHRLFWRFFGRLFNSNIEKHSDKE